MHNCRENSALISKAMDQALSLRERLAVRLHLLMCARCRRFEQQTHFLRKAAHRYTDELQTHLNNKP